MTKLCSCWIEEMPREYQKAIKAVYKIKKKKSPVFVVVLQLPSYVRLFAIPWAAAQQASLELAQVHVHGISDSIQPSHPLLPSSSFNLFQHQSLFQWVSSLHQVTKVLSFSLSISGLNDLFRVDFVVQGTLKGLIQHHSFKALILQCSALFMVHLSYLCMTTGKTIALTRHAFVSKVMSYLNGLVVFHYG